MGGCILFVCMGVDRYDYNALSCMSPSNTSFPSLLLTRYISPHSAQRAMQQLQGIKLQAGRPLALTLNYQKTYFSQDESTGETRKKKPGVVMHFDPY